MDWLVASGIIVALFLLGKYAIEEGQRIEKNKNK